MAAVRLRRVVAEYGGRVSIRWKSFPLMTENRLGRPISPHGAESRIRAATEEPQAFIRPWDTKKPYPGSSMPAQAAAKCALNQSRAGFERFHQAAFRALFQESRDIGDSQVLLELARESGLDLDRFRADFEGGALEEAVNADYEEARHQYEGWGIPLAIIGGRYPLVGAVPVEMYRRAIDLCLTRV